MYDFDFLVYENLVTISCFHTFFIRFFSSCIRHSLCRVGTSLVPRLSSRLGGGGCGEPGISRIMNARKFQTHVAP